ncbi:siderophore ABC transporter substrate-binding protein [Myroides pelagicus]|uniref:ABC transporter substrate-binding protein n=1 Tax=Myroides pelagicus TaxID=270914 RepID=A0A7K1GKW9_9FLAO|nr:siderophore ABC transporter substrate-binding protein [Myroides pelagicus]MEC4114097.1 siderophore ABC transporter substrate-binding protein [Myroides pelagicus]MTH29179.1 ABC transporter substrate-binding protein [Myroides pelagicus]
MSKLFISCLAASAVLFVSCKDTKKQEDNTNRTKIEVTHSSGKTEVLTQPKNAVVISYGALDTFDELGIPVKGAPKTNLPSYLDKYAKDENVVDIGGIKNPNLEKVNATSTELIVVGARNVAIMEELNKIAPSINLDVNAEDYMTSFRENQQAIGQLYGKEAEVEKELTDIDARIESIKKKTAASNKKGLIVLTNEGRLSAYGPGSRFGIIHDVFGVKPTDSKIEVARHGQSISNEFIKEVNPDYIFVIDRGAAIKKDVMTQEAFANVLIQQTNAYKNGKVIFLDPEVWYLSGGGLKSIKMMISEIEKAIAE